jgi:hypothetical protein
MEVLLQESRLVLSRNRQALTGDVSIRVEDGEIIAGKLLTLHQFPLASDVRHNELHLFAKKVQASQL